MDNSRSYSMLIAGVTGSGKSYLENDIIHKLINQPDAQFILIDPKRVELAEYKKLPQTLYYASGDDDIYDVLMSAYDIMERRFDDMADRGIKNTDEPHIFVFIDEMAFLMQTDKKKEYAQVLSRIAIKGRAAHVHLVLCSQVCTQDVIPACIRDNVNNIICLRQRDAGKYRYLLGTAPGRLPLYGFAYVSTPVMERPEKTKAEDVWQKIAG